MTFILFKEHAERVNANVTAKYISSGLKHPLLQSVYVR